jgi:fibro-slime domain-containing protein
MRSAIWSIVVLLVVLGVVQRQHVVLAGEQGHSRACDSDADCCGGCEEERSAIALLYPTSTTHGACLNGTCRLVVDKRGMEQCTNTADCATRLGLGDSVGVVLVSGWSCNATEPFLSECVDGTCMYAAKRPPLLAGNPGQCPACYEFVPLLCADDDATSGVWGTCVEIPDCCIRDGDCEPCYACRVVNGSSICVHMDGCCATSKDCSVASAALSTSWVRPLCSEYECVGGWCVQADVCAEAGGDPACADDDMSTTDHCMLGCRCCHDPAHTDDECVDDGDCAGWTSDPHRRCIEVIRITDGYSDVDPIMRTSTMICTSDSGTSTDDCTLVLPRPDEQRHEWCDWDGECADGEMCCGGGRCSQSCSSTQECRAGSAPCGGRRDSPCCEMCVCDRCCSPETPCKDMDTIPVCAVMRDFASDEDGMERMMAEDTGVVAPHIGDDMLPEYNPSATPHTFYGGNATFWCWYHDCQNHAVLQTNDVFVLVRDIFGDPQRWLLDSAPRTSNDEFFPIDGRGLGNDGTDRYGEPRNYHFSLAACFWFTHIAGGGRIDYETDDDLWVYVDGQLVIDAGGILPTRVGYVSFGSGLVIGSLHQCCVFKQDRRMVDSAFHFSIREDVQPSCADTGNTCIGHICDRCITSEDCPATHAMCCHGRCSAGDCCVDDDCWSDDPECVQYSCCERTHTCVERILVDCDDGVGCTEDWCTFGECVHGPDDSVCAANFSEYSDLGECGIPYCDWKQGCIVTPDDSVCPSIPEQCLEGICCLSEHPPTCVYQRIPGCGNESSSPSIESSSPGIESSSPGIESSSPGIESSSPVIESSSPSIESSSLIIESSSPSIESSSPSIESSSPSIESSSPIIESSSPSIESSSPSIESSSVISSSHEPPHDCDSSYAKHATKSICFIGLEGGKSNNWGWTNGPLSPGSYSLNIYMHAAQCDISKGELVGTVTVYYTVPFVTVVLNTSSQWCIASDHVYVGSTLMPIVCHGHNDCSYTYAPGQFPQHHDRDSEDCVSSDMFIFDGMNGSNIYVSVHAIICENSQYSSSSSSSMSSVTSESSDLCEGVVCYDWDECTFDWCDPSTGFCLFIPGGCDDDWGCCSGRCVPPGAPTDDDCISNDTCISMWCDPETGCMTALVEECRCHNDSECVSANASSSLCTRVWCDVETGVCVQTADINCTEQIPRDACSEVGSTPECAWDFIQVCLGGHVDVLAGLECNETTGRCPWITGCADGDCCTLDWCRLAPSIETSDQSQHFFECVHERRNCDDGQNDTMDYCDSTTCTCEHKHQCGSGSSEVDCDCEWCDDHDMCTDEECDHEHGICVHVPIDCEDNNACTMDLCIAGACIYIPAIDCSAYGDACTTAACNETSGECYIAGRIECIDDDSDADACTFVRCDRVSGTCVPARVDCGSDSVGPCASVECVDGECIRHDHPVCFDTPEIASLLNSSKCLIPSCTPDTGCTISERRCDIGDACTVGACDPDTGGCMWRSIDCGCGDPELSACVACGCESERGGCYMDTLSCDDHNACTNDTCDYEGGCMHDMVDCGCDESGRSRSDLCLECWCSDDAGGCVLRGVDCDDEDPTTIDECVSIDGTCRHRRRECNDTDADACTDVILDEHTGECVTRPIACPEWHGDMCHWYGPCDPATGICPLLSTECEGSHLSSSDDACTTYVCDPDTGNCVGRPIECDDENPCTVDDCVDGACVNEPVTCNPSAFGMCGSATCDSDAGGCVDLPTDCNDYDGCTSDWCDQSTGLCMHGDWDGGVCRNRSTHCVECGCGSSGGPRSARFAVRRSPNSREIPECLCVPKDCSVNPEVDLCHVGWCDQATGACRTSPICVEGPIDACTSGSCDVDTGSCTVSSDVDCDDHNPCTVDRCDPDAGCMYTLLECADSDPCTIDGCSADAGGCVNVVMDCDDDDTETIDECVNGTCTHRRRFPCDDGLWCTTDVVDPQTGECIYQTVDCGLVYMEDGSVDMCAYSECDESAGGICVTVPVDCSDYYVRSPDVMRELDVCHEFGCDHATGDCTVLLVDCDDCDKCTHDECNMRTGVCMHVPVDCNDDNMCTDDSCDVATGMCINAPKQCGDGDACTRDWCDHTTGGCVHGPRKLCDGVSPDVCDECECVATTGRCECVRRDCDDGNMCTVDECNSTTGECGHEAYVCPLVPCMNTAVCATNDGSCKYSDPTDCGDGMQCDHATGECVDIEASSSRSVGSESGVPCPPTTGADPCMVYGLEDDGEMATCVANPKDCSDGDPCTVDSCNSSSSVGVCVHTRYTCDDGDACTADECDGDIGTCTHVRNDCDDGDACTYDRCNSVSGQCSNHVVWTGDGSFNWTTGQPTQWYLSRHWCDAWKPFGRCYDHHHDDGGSDEHHDSSDSDDTDECGSSRWMARVGCTLVVCSPDVGIFETRPVVCDDGNPCTDDSCQDAVGECTHVPTMTACDDGNLCTYDDCVPLGRVEFACYHSRKRCDDGLFTTFDWCDDASGTCRHSRVSCENRDPCIVNMTVDGACVALPRDCNDHNVCTDDRCDAVARSCVYTQTQRCDDGDPCTEDTCNRYTGACTHTLRHCSDGDACTIDTCDQSSGMCVATRVSCDDDDPCTADVCNRYTGACKHIQKSCSDGNACTHDMCLTADGSCAHIPFVHETDLFHENDHTNYLGACYYHWCDPENGEWHVRYNMTCTVPHTRTSTPTRNAGATKKVTH